MGRSAVVALLKLFLQGLCEELLFLLRYADICTHI